ncbi:unnamed protein product [Gadus morhua 'NCC']
MSALYGSLRAQRWRGERGSTREQNADLKVSSQKQSLEGKHFLKMAGMANLILRGGGAETRARCLGPAPRSRRLSVEPYSTAEERGSSPRSQRGSSPRSQWGSSLCLQEQHTSAAVSTLNGRLQGRQSRSRGTQGDRQQPGQQSQAALDRVRQLMDTRGGTLNTLSLPCPAREDPTLHLHFVPAPRESRRPPSPCPPIQL